MRRMLFKLVHKHGYAQTKVVVHNGSKSQGTGDRSQDPTAGTSGIRAKAAPRSGYSREPRQCAAVPPIWPY